MIRLQLARQRGNLSAVAEAAQRLQALAEAPDGAQPGLGEELRALALISLGATEAWLGQFDQALPHLEQGTALAHRIGRPFLEFTGLAHQAVIEFYLSFSRSARLSMQAHELAERHGWTDEPGAGTACMVLGAVLAWQGQPEKAEPWIQRAERIIRAEAEPAVAVGVHHHRGAVELGRGRYGDALTAFRAAERQARHFAAPHLLMVAAPTMHLQTLVRLGRQRARRKDPGRTRRPRA